MLDDFNEGSLASNDAALCIYFDNCCRNVTLSPPYTCPPANLVLYKVVNGQEHVKVVRFSVSNTIRLYEPPGVVPPITISEVTCNYRVEAKSLPSGPITATFSLGCGDTAVPQQTRTLNLSSNKKTQFSWVKTNFFAARAVHDTFRVQCGYGPDERPHPGQCQPL